MTRLWYATGRKITIYNKYVYTYMQIVTMTIIPSQEKGDSEKCVTYISKQTKQKDECIQKKKKRKRKKVRICILFSANALRTYPFVP